MTDRLAWLLVCLHWRAGRTMEEPYPAASVDAVEG